MVIPTEQECMELMAEVSLAPAIVRHSIAVKKVALEFADRLERNGVEVDRRLISAAALLHDIMKLDAEFCHGIEGGEFLRGKGFHEVASVVEKHCLSNVSEPNLAPSTVEDKLLVYADLRVNHGKMVSLDERFEYLRERYGLSPERFQHWFDVAKGIERDLFSDRSEEK